MIPCPGPIRRRNDQYNSHRWKLRHSWRHPPLKCYKSDASLRVKIHLLSGVYCNSFHEEVLVRVYSKLRRITIKLGGFCIAINSVQTASPLAVNDSIALYWRQPRTRNIVKLLAAIWMRPLPPPCACLWSVETGTRNTFACHRNHNISIGTVRVTFCAMCQSF